MFKQPNGWSTAPLSVSRASDRQKHFKVAFTHLHHAVFFFSFSFSSHLISEQPGSGTPDLQAPRAQCDRPNQIAAEKFISECQPARNTKGPQHSKNIGVNILQLLKAIPGRHPFFIRFSSYFEISLWVICFGCEKDINIWVLVFISMFLCAASGNVVLTNKLFSSQPKTL